MKIIRPVEITDSNLDSTNVPETDHAAWNSGTTYALGDNVIVTTPNVHTVYESLQAGNTNNDPTLAASASWWLDVGATNAWRMFDERMGTRTTNATSIEVTLDPGRVNAIALLELDAATLQIVMDDPTDGEVYNSGVIDLVDDMGIQDWYAYFFEDIVRQSDYVAFDLPPYSSATIDVTLSAPGDTAECGKLVVGSFAELGYTQYGLASGIADYSRKETDDYGNVYLDQRSYAKTIECDLFIDNAQVDTTRKILDDLRATPIVWVGASEYSLSITYGFYNDFSVVIEGPNHSICNIQIEGMI